MSGQTLIVTLADDIHGLAVQAAVRKKGIGCEIVESDCLSGRESMTHYVGEECEATSLRTSEGKLVDIASVHTIWWRRFKSNQQSFGATVNESHQSLTNNDCFGALTGSLQTTFAGRWISHPRSTEHASNKLIQLTTARACGMRIPDTVVTQSPGVVREFYRLHEGRIIVKPVVGTPGPLLFTQMVCEDHLNSADSIRSCPAIYQQFISGTKHIRLNCFGRNSFAGLIETNDLDWRPNLNVPIVRWEVPEFLHQQVRKILDTLGLDMGIVDLKLTPTGEFIWLEVNPQGQFLFLEGLTGEPLTEHFANYLVKS